MLTNCLSPPDQFQIFRFVLAPLYSTGPLPCLGFPGQNWAKRLITPLLSWSFSAHVPPITAIVPGQSPFKVPLSFSDSARGSGNSGWTVHHISATWLACKQPDILHVPFLRADSFAFHYLLPGIHHESHHVFIGKALKKCSFAGSR